MIKKFNITIALLILLSNIYFIYISCIILSTSGGPFGFGGLILTFTFLAHLFMFPSIMVLKKKYHRSPILLLTNTIGATYYLLILVMFLL